MPKDRLDDRELRRLLDRFAPEAARHAVVYLLPPERLEPNPWRPVVLLDPESMDRLAEEIRFYGLREPLLARRLPGERYQVLAGAHDAVAALRVGLDTVPVLVVELDEPAAMAIALADAMARERLSPWEEAQGLAELAETLRELGQEADPVRLATLLDHTPEWVRSLQRIAERLSPAVLEQAGLSVHDMIVLPQAALLRAAEPDDPAERARRLREAHERARGSL